MEQDKFVLRNKEGQYLSPCREWVTALKIEDDPERNPFNVAEIFNGYSAIMEVMGAFAGEIVKYNEDKV